MKPQPSRNNNNYPTAFGNSCHGAATVTTTALVVLFLLFVVVEVRVVVVRVLLLWLLVGRCVSHDPASLHRFAK